MKRRNYVMHPQRRGNVQFSTLQSQHSSTSPLQHLIHQHGFQSVTLYIHFLALQKYCHGKFISERCILNWSKQPSAVCRCPYMRISVRGNAGTLVPLLYLIHGFPRSLFGRHGAHGDPAAMAIRSLVTPVWIRDQMCCFISRKPTTSWHQARKTQLKTWKKNFDMILFFSLQDKKNCFW